MRPIDTCAHVKLVSADYARRHQLAPILKEVDVLARHAETLTGYLEKALGLGVDDDKVPRDSRLYRPSLAAHDQIRDDDDWTHLIDLARDSYFALAAVTRRPRGESAPTVDGVRPGTVQATCASRAD